MFNRAGTYRNDRLRAAAMRNATNRMKFTNHTNLPQAIVDAIVDDDYSTGGADISVTGLISPPRIRVLRERHDAELEEDVADKLFILAGKSVHLILARKGREAMVEERLFTERLGWKISGQPDRYEFTPRGELIDWKFTSTWVANTDGKVEWEQQMNLYALLLREQGFVVSELAVWAIYRDWKKNTALRDPGYPQTQAQRFAVPLWDPDVAEAFLLERVKLHQAARERLPHCTDAERWARPTWWAVTKPGAKKAMRVLPGRAEAEALARGVKGAVVEERPGGYVRCDGWCPVRPFCEAEGDGQW